MEVTRLNADTSLLACSQVTMPASRVVWERYFQLPPARRAKTFLNSSFCSLPLEDRSKLVHHVANDFPGRSTKAWF